MGYDALGVDVIDFTSQAKAPGPARGGSGLVAPIVLAALALGTGSGLGLAFRSSGPSHAQAIVAVVPEGTPEVLVFTVAPVERTVAPSTAPDPTVAGAPAGGGAGGEAPAAEAPSAPATAPVATPVATPASSPAGIFAGVRVWSNGDSTSYYMSAALLGMVMRGGGTAATAPSYVVSSGLLNPGLYDWPANLAAEMALYAPDIVVFMVGANDANGAAANPEGYRALVGATMDQLRAPGRTVAWVGQPPMGREDLAVSIPVVNRIFREEAAKRPWVTFVDTYPVLSDAAGGYAGSLPGPGGEAVRMRADDGVHLTPAAGERLALAVFSALFPGVAIP